MSSRAVATLRLRFLVCNWFLCGTAFATLVPVESGHAQSYTILYSFQGGSDGAQPWAGVTADQHGNLYGTTYQGGNGPCAQLPGGCGTVFKLAVNGSGYTESLLWSFCTQGGECADGAFPQAGLTLGRDGILYGTSFGPGSDTTAGLPPGKHCSKSCGNLYAILGADSEKVLQSFPEDSYPEAPLLLHAGRFYGTTSQGGANGYGTVFELNTKLPLHSFPAGPDDGAGPVGPLVADPNGNIFGTTAYGGGTNGFGIVFELSQSGGVWIETVLYTFAGGTDGSYPTGLVADQAGNLYGMTAAGGGAGCGDGCGTIFKLAPGGSPYTYTLLHAFAGAPNDGSRPYDSLAMDKAGNLYGTTEVGGVSDEGTVFKLAPDGSKYLVVHSFPQYSGDGVNPKGGLIAKGGYVYGTTFGGGSGENGVVFKLSVKGG